MGDDEDEPVYGYPPLDASTGQYRTQTAPPPDVSADLVPTPTYVPHQIPQTGKTSLKSPALRKSNERPNDRPKRDPEPLVRFADYGVTEIVE